MREGVLSAPSNHMGLRTTNVYRNTFGIDMSQRRRTAVSGRIALTVPGYGSDDSAGRYRTDPTVEIIGDIQVPGGIDRNTHCPFNCAAVAGPPSPEKPALPVPATVLMVPAGFTLRTTFEEPVRLVKSALYKLLIASKDKP